MLLFECLSKYFLQSLFPNLEWASAFEGNDIVPFDMDIFPNGDLILVGGFIGTADFDPGPGVNNISTQVSNDVDAFVMRLDSNGKKTVFSRQIQPTKN